MNFRHGNRASPLVSVYMEKFSSRQARSRLFQARSRQPGHTCPYKRKIIFTVKITTQRDLAYRAVSLSAPARLPYKQALTILLSSQRLSVLKHCPLGIDFVRKTTCTRMRVWIKVVKLRFILHSATMVEQQFTPEERTLMVLLYHERGSPARTIEAFVRRFLQTEEQS